MSDSSPSEEIKRLIESVRVLRYKLAHISLSRLETRFPEVEGQVGKLADEEIIISALEQHLARLEQNQRDLEK